MSEKCPRAVLPAPKRDFRSTRTRQRRGQPGPKLVGQLGLMEGLEQLLGLATEALGGILAPLRTLTFWHMKRRACRFGESGAAERAQRGPRVDAARAA